MLSRFRKTWNALLRRESWESELDGELRSHAELRAADLLRSGLSKDAAERQARIELGSRERYKDEARAAFGLRWLDDARQDVSYGIRTLVRSPGFTLTAIVSLALGVGANTVVFSVLNAVLFRPIPVSDPDSLLFVQMGSNESVSFPDYRDYRDRSTTIDGAIAYRAGRMALSEGQGAQGQDAERYWGYLATGNYFDVLGLRPAIGRFFHAEDEKGVNASPFAVLSYDLWQSRFHGDTNIAGREVRVNTVPYTVLGVAPRGFRGTESFLSVSLWVPISMEQQIEGFAWLESRGNHNAWMLVRAKKGVTALQAAADMNRVAADLAKQYPATNTGKAVVLAKPGLLGNLLRRPVEQFVTGVMFVAGLVLLAACANLAGLLGARSADRFREIALRISIGAGRGRIFRQLLTESVVLTSIAGAFGCAAAWFLLRALSQWHPPLEVPVQADVLPDVRVLLFSVAASMVTGILAGIAPARQAWRMSTNDALKGTVVRRRQWPVRDIALLVETAVCCVLVVSSFVAGRGLLRAFSTRPGFDAKGVSVVSFDPILARYSKEDSERFQRRARDIASQLPGAISVAYAKSVPMTADQSNTDVYPEDAPELRPEQARSIGYYSVSPGYFKTMGTRVLYGREFDWRDTREAPLVVVVNETFARQFFGTTNAIGKRVRARRGTSIEVAGVVQDGKYFTFTEDPKPILYWSILQNGDTGTVLIVRSSLPEATMAGQMAGAVRTLDPAMPVYGVGSLNDMIGLAFLPAWIASIALGAFGVLAAMLAVTGIYGLASYSVSRRVREIGIRMAIGAPPAQVLWTVMGRLASLVAGGAVAGIMLGAAFGKILSAVVYQASSRDPLILAAVASVMLVIAAASALGPVRRALSLDPLRALRQE